MTAIDEVADGIYRISTLVEASFGMFSYNQYLIADDEPLLFHTGKRAFFEQTREAIARIMPVERLRYISFSHFEADECGALNELLALAPQAVPLCGKIAAMVSVHDYADRPPRALDDGETIRLGRHEVQWLYSPHLPHAWECGFLVERATATLLCSDLFTQPGDGNPALTEGDILGPSEALRRQLDYYAHTRDTAAQLERLAKLAPKTLACMHGSAWRGDGAGLLRALAGAIAGS